MNERGWGGGGLASEASRRRTVAFVSPAQQARRDIAVARSRESVRRLREADPEWREPTSAWETVEGEIAHHEAVGAAAEARVGEITRDAIPGTNPSWGVYRLRKELGDRGYVLEGPTRGQGLMLANPETGEKVRIMDRPRVRYSNDPPEKHFFEQYYRYRPGHGKPEGRHVPIPDKD